MNYDHAFISLGAKKLRKKRRVTLGVGRGGLYSKIGFIGGGSAPRFNPLSILSYTIFDRKVIPSSTFY